MPLAGFDKTLAEPLFALGTRRRYTIRQDLVLVATSQWQCRGPGVRAEVAVGAPQCPTGAKDDVREGRVQYSGSFTSK